MVLPVFSQTLPKGRRDLILKNGNMAIEIKKGNLYLIKYTNTVANAIASVNPDNKTKYKSECLLVGFFNPGKREENEDYFVGAMFNRLSLLDQCISGEVVLDRYVFDRTCEILKDLGEII